MSSLLKFLCPSDTFSKRTACLETSHTVWLCSLRPTRKIAASRALAQREKAVLTSTPVFAPVFVSGNENKKNVLYRLKPAKGNHSILVSPQAPQEQESKLFVNRASHVRATYRVPFYDRIVIHFDSNSLIIWIVPLGLSKLVTLRQLHHTSARS